MMAYCTELDRPRKGLRTCLIHLTLPKTVESRHLTTNTSPLVLKATSIVSVHKIPVARDHGNQSPSIQNINYRWTTPSGHTITLYMQE